MFDVTKRIPTNDTDDKPAQPGGGTLLARLAGAEGQRINLPRGSAAPTWVADEAWRKRGRRVN